MGSHIKHDDVLYIAYIICLVMIVLFSLMRVSIQTKHMLLNKNVVVLDWVFNIVLNVFLNTQWDEFYLVKPRE